MRVLTLTQPWASLVALGLKRVETRSWGTNYRGEVLIHASAERGRVPRAARATLRAQTMPYRGVSFERSAALAAALDHDGPYGVALCVSRLEACDVMTPESIHKETELERLLGGWAPGRFAWGLGPPEPLSEPMPLVGGLGLRTLSEERSRVLAALRVRGMGRPRGCAVFAALELAQREAEAARAKREALALWKAERKEVRVGGQVVRLRPACPEWLPGRAPSERGRRWQGEDPPRCGRCGCDYLTHLVPKPSGQRQ